MREADTQGAQAFSVKELRDQLESNAERELKIPRVTATTIDDL